MKTIETNCQDPQRVIFFSGGRTSGFMLRLILNNTQLFDYKVIFCNTGKERNETLDFVHEVETRWNVPIIWVEYHRALASSVQPDVFPTKKRNENLAKAALNEETIHWFKEVTYETASRNGDPFDELIEWAGPLPNVVNRVCSKELKIRTAMRYLFSLGIKEYCSIIGIRKDEEHRAIQVLANCDSFEHPQFPLVGWNITEKDVTEFWRENDFDLKLKSYEGNCDLCFLKAKWKRLRLIQENPGMVNWWKNWEKKKSKQITEGGTQSGTMFRINESYSDLEQIAEHEKDQNEFCFVKGTERDIPCSCVERAFEPETI